MNDHHHTAQDPLPIGKVELRGMENSVLIRNRRGAVIAEVFTDKEPSDQYEQAAAMAAALEMRAALADLCSATLPGAPQNQAWIAAAHRRATAALEASDLATVLNEKPVPFAPRMRS